MKNQLKPIMLCAVISMILIALMTDFRFIDVTVEMPNIYFTMGPVRAWIYLAAMLWTCRNFYLAIDIGTERSAVFSVVLAIVNPIVMLVLIMVLYFDVMYVSELLHSSSDKNFVSLVLPIGVLVGLIVIQTIVEIRTLRKLRKSLRSF